MIVENKILEAQKAWGEGIVRIGKVFLDKGDYSAAAKEHIDEFYNYQGLFEVLGKNPMIET